MYAPDTIQPLNAVFHLLLTITFTSQHRCFYNHLPPQVVASLLHHKVHVFEANIRASQYKTIIHNHNDVLKEVILCFWGFCLSFIVLCSIFVHVNDPCQRELLSPTENTALAKYIFIFYIFILKYKHSSHSAGEQLLLLLQCYFRSHYLAQHDPASEWLHPAR